ncbi:aspartate 4-decarboxylase [Actinorhabdospora filicis]|uniref:Aspartate 4-decarboxylase n=1 Tax=Actinorhabdospora filicis TaxID=1785913 RepID=A0A9W6WB19_9ACTN|nr:bifunctional aspartate transaminase/aspartate 4-decarboxylase [Actinorhabdospora filicis]GLZ79146.1 aspartate 4-decarboxylase [Actinorhabdospora filicis]
MTTIDPAGTKTSRDEEHQLLQLSPFEIKNRLIELADENAQAGAGQMLNAGRGNPNWVATVPRAAFGLLLRFALEESNRAWSEWSVLGGMPAKGGIAERFTAFLTTNRHETGADLLTGSVAYGVDRLGFDPDTWVHELTDAVIGDNYPVPDRMLTCIEQVVHEYIVKEMCAGTTPAEGRFDLFATEGGTAAMCYIFDTAIINRLLKPGDTIAIMTPIFTPYLEIPHLERYQFNVLELQADKVDQDGFHTWQYPDAEIDKLADPSVKALFCVNPSNPPSVMLAPETLNRIATIVKEKNKNLTVITDDVYGTFVNGFQSLMAAVPRNTIGVYSFSKYFGCTGWRLGVIAVNQDNVFDEMLAAHDQSTKDLLNKRYSTITLEPEKLRFIDRLVADSRQVALNHTAGLSTPQQTQMALFSLQALLDEGDEYKHICQSIIARRMNALTKGMGVNLPHDPHSAHYYTELDLLSWAERNWGAEFAAWMQETYEPVDPIFRLAEKGSIVLLNGGGFDGPDWSVRVSMANLPMDAYEKIGSWLWEIGQEYKAEFDKRNGG